MSRTKAFLSQSLLVLIPFTFCISCNNHTCPLNTNNKVSQDENATQMEMQDVYFSTACTIKQLHHITNVKDGYQEHLEVL